MENSEFQRINAPRVEKILKMMDTIATSAKSNKAEAEMADLLRPIAERLGGGTAQPPSAPRPQAAQRAATWFQLREAAEEAPLKDLMAVAAVIHSRVDALVHDTADQ